MIKKLNIRRKITKETWTKEEKEEKNNQTVCGKNRR